MVKRNLLAYPILLILSLIWTINLFFYYASSKSNNSDTSNLMPAMKIFANSSLEDLSQEDLAEMESLRARIIRPKYDVRCKRIFELDQVNDIILKNFKIYISNIAYSM